MSADVREEDDERNGWKMDLLSWELEKITMILSFVPPVAFSPDY